MCGCVGVCICVRAVPTSLVQYHMYATVSSSLKLSAFSFDQSQKFHNTPKNGEGVGDCINVILEVMPVV